MRKMFKLNSLIFGISLVFLGSIGGSAKAQSNSSCPTLRQKIDFSVNTVPRDIDYKLGVSQRKMTQLAQKVLRSRSSRNERVLGLTSTGHSISYQMRSQTARIGRNRFCARIASVDMEILVTKLNVYVLGKYRRGSCEYTAVIDHEHEHVATFQTGIENLEQKFNDQLWSIIRNLPPGFSSTPKLAGQAVFRNLKRSINRVKNPIERLMKSRNRQIDTPLSYKRLTQQCSKW
jgi:hypothetical protein